MKIMKYTVALLLISMLIVSFCGYVYAEEASAVLPEASEITDISEGEDSPYKMEKEDETRWFSFEMHEAGEAILIFNFYGSKNPRKITCYDEGLNKLKTKTELFSRNSYNCSAFVALRDLPAGKYYIKTETNTNCSSDVSAEMYLVRLSPSVIPTRNSADVAIVSKAGEIICYFEGAYFIKLYDGEATAAMTLAEKESPTPLLVGESSSSVMYLNSVTLEAQSSDRMNNKYYTDIGIVSKYTDKDFSLSDLPIFAVETGYGYDMEMREALRNIERQKIGDLAYFLRYELFWLILIIAAVAVLIIGLVSLIRHWNDSDISTPKDFFERLFEDIDLDACDD